ncbi:MAG: hypothetical protein D6729_00210 [Deltaproteobacteria bacterium]|nr:MAG: hypothetical protein D6729_00210 [Deltaproteobacteria bacterium]
MPRRRPASPHAAWAALWLLTAAACPRPTGAGNVAPSADGGPDQTVPLGRTVVLHGSCTDPDPEDAGRLEYRWNLEDWPLESSLGPGDIEGRERADAYFRPDVTGVWRFSFQCDDGKAASAIDSVTVTVTPPPPNAPPVVDAGEDQQILLGDTVRLVASASDPDGDPLTFTWSLAAVPGGSGLDDADLVQDGGPQLSATPDVAGAYTFEVTAQDGRGGEARDSVAVTVEAVERLAGELRLRVLAVPELEPVPDVPVFVGGQPAGSTDAEGRLVYTDPALTGPVAVSAVPPGVVAYDHDSDPDTPSLDVPEWVATTVTGIDRAEATLLVHRSAVAEAARSTGRVVAYVPQTLFDRLPPVERMFSVAGGRMSGQLRMVLLAPVLPRHGLATLDLGDVFAPSQTPEVPLPGNLATDDLFFDENAALFGRSPGPGGEPAFTRIEIEVPPGPRRFYVLAGIATVDLARLLPLLAAGGGAGALTGELGVVLGAIEFQTLAVGIVEAEVPEGGVLDLSSLLAEPDRWPLLARVDYASAQVQEEVCDSSGSCLSLDRVRLFPADELTLTTSEALADPRLAAAVPESAPFERYCTDGGAPAPCDPPQILDLTVPPDVHTDLPFEVDLVGLVFPPGHALLPEGGVVPTGFRVPRAPQHAAEEVRFAVPRLEGPLGGLSYAAVSIQARRLLTGPRGDVRFSPGRVMRLARGLVPGARATWEDPPPLPRLAGDPGGLRVEVRFDVADNTQDPPVVRGAWALSLGPGPTRDAPDLPAELAREGNSLSPGPELTVLGVAAVVGESTMSAGLPTTVPLWEIWVPPGSSPLPVPPAPVALPPAGEGVWLSVTDLGFDASFSYQRPDPGVFAGRRAWSSRDTWAFRVPPP